MRVAAALAAVLIAAAAVGYARLLHADYPRDPGGSVADTIVVGDRARTYRYYVPAQPGEAAPLVLAFHGSGGSGTLMRAMTGHALERLADRHGFLVIYPDGYSGHWNDCRVHGPYDANRENIDDPGFVRALVAHFRREHGAGERVFALGLSNGGHMAYRLALESPDLVTGVAAFAASLPTDDDSDCTASAVAVPTLIVNGTDDPINPFAGGVVTIFGFGNRGRVLSSDASARHFAALAGAPADPVPERDGDASTWVERTTWRGRDAEVVLLTIHGGGHTIPQPDVRMPRILGRTSRDVDGLLEAWRFFERQRARHARAEPEGTG